MRIIVREITAENGHTLARFTCPCGNAWGYWQGETPVLNGEYDIEPELPSLNSPDATLRYVEVREPALFVEGDTIVLRGRFTGTDDNGALQLGDAIVLLDGQLSGYLDSDAVEVRVKSTTG